MTDTGFFRLLTTEWASCILLFSFAFFLHKNVKASCLVIQYFKVIILFHQIFMKSSLIFDNACGQHFFCCVYIQQLPLYISSFLLVVPFLPCIQIATWTRGIHRKKIVKENTFQGASRGFFLEEFHFILKFKNRFNLIYFELLITSFCFC